MARLFGTDGVRGTANKDITADFSLRLAQAAAVVLAAGARERGERPRAVIAKDPRVSSDFISAAVSAGLASSGVDVFFINFYRSVLIFKGFNSNSIEFFFIFYFRCDFF